MSCKLLYNRKYSFCFGGYTAYRGETRYKCEQRRLNGWLTSDTLGQPLASIVSARTVIGQLEQWLSRNALNTSGGLSGGRSRRHPPPPPPRSGSQKQKNRPDLGRNMLQNASFEASDIIFFRGSMPPGPSRAYETDCGVYIFLKELAPPPPPRLSIPGSATEYTLHG